LISLKYSENLVNTMPQFHKRSDRSYADVCKHDWKHSRHGYHNAYKAFHRGHDAGKNPIAIDPANTLGARNYDQIVIFGDSLSDTGNLSKALGGVFPPFPYFNGRLSNGPLWIDQLAPKLGFKSEQVLNFAFAGATTGRLNVGEVLAGVQLPIKLPGLLDEVDAFTALNPKGANPKSLYVVFAGANDFLTLPPTLFQGLAVGNLESFIGLYGAIVQSVQNIATAVTNLALQGAGTIAIANLPNLGRTPLPNQQGTSLVATAFSIGFNVVLEKTLTQLEQSLRSKSLKVDLVQVDLFSVGEAVAKRPQEFGFTNLTDPLIKQLANNPKNPQGFFYWDDFHPTTQAHTVIADAFHRSLSKPTGSKVLESSLAVVKDTLNSGAVRPIVDRLLAQAQPFLASGGLQKLLNGQPLTV
jgi:phospholipase/lecithinase/hemolysin